MSMIQRFSRHALLFSLCSLVLTACNLLTNPAEAPVLDNSARTPTETTDSGGSIFGAVTTYTDDSLGFAFDYPSSWHILDSVAGAVVIIASFPRQEPGTKQTSEGIPADQSKMDFIVLPQGTTLESAANEQRHQENSTITREENLILPSGLKAVRLDINSTMGGDVPVLLIEVNSRIVLIAAYGDTAPFDAIVRTMHLRA